MCNLAVEHCEICSPTSNRCNECVDGYFVNMDRECMRCDERIDECKRCSHDGDVCFECNHMHTLTNNRCVICSSIDNCQECSQTQFKCLRCFANHFPDHDGMCYPCTRYGCLENKCSQTERKCFECDLTIDIVNNFPRSYNYNHQLGTCNSIYNNQSHCLYTQTYEGCHFCEHGMFFFRIPDVNHAVTFHNV